MSVSQSARGQTSVSADVYRNKLMGMWVGELIGNYAGRPREGYVQRGGLNYDVDWDSAVAIDTWDGDDDTCFELLYADVLAANADPTPAQIGQEWRDHILPNTFYIANRQARYLMERSFIPPQTGSINNNMHWYAIDSQITTESIGAMTPGMRQRASDLTGRFASVSNEGFPVHAAQFYAAMYAAGATESNVEALVDLGLEVVPHTSRTYQIIDDVRTWFQQDRQDGTLDWRATQTKIYDKYGGGSQSNGRYYNWIESSVNTAMTTMALLYGGGDFKKTVEIGVQGGFDSDCNPATAAGLVGMIKGYSNLPADLIAACGQNYQASGWLVNMNRTRTISAIADELQQAAEAQLLQCGGSISGSGAGKTYWLPGDTVSPPLEKPDPAGPAGLVGQFLAMGGAVTTSASVEWHDANNDRRNLDAIIDGIKDVTYNGRQPYSTDDGENAAPAGGDYYQLNFSQPVVFNKVIFYEGDYVWSKINTDPLQQEPRGGFFTTLTVEVRRDGVFREAGHLQLSEPLDANKFYQIIEMTFDPAYGDAVRICGSAGGTGQFTTILELEAYGAITRLGDCNLDGEVSLGDLGILSANWNKAGVMNWYNGDFSGDGKVDLGDLGIMAGNWGWHLPSGAPNAPIPEPASAVLLTLGGVAILRRRQRLIRNHW